MVFTWRMVPEVIQPFWAALQRGEFITGAAEGAGTYRKKGARWMAAEGDQQLIVEPCQPALRTAARPTGRATIGREPGPQPAASTAVTTTPGTFIDMSGTITRVHSHGVSAGVDFAGAEYVMRRALEST